MKMLAPNNDDDLPYARYQDQGYAPIVTGGGGGYIAPPGAAPDVAVPLTVIRPTLSVTPPAGMPSFSPCSTCLHNAGGGPSAPYGGSTPAGGGYITPPNFNTSGTPPGPALDEYGDAIKPKIQAMADGIADAQATSHDPPWWLLLVLGALLGLVVNAGQK